MSRVLIANRGEIALRIIRACRELGHEAILVYSEADAETLPVRMADEAYCIGPPEVGQSYLDQEAILAVAEMTEADAVHPGYGLLAENASFSRNVDHSGFTFIGPSAETIELMGQKAAARSELADVGVPVLPGSEGDVKSLDEARDVAHEVGFPIMLKASEGGGGRGIARVRDDEELEEQFERVSSEAEAAFGSGRLYIEKLIDNPRHIEIQVMGDGKGEVVHFFERECSIQRRHQKLLEEAPSPAVSPEVREELTSTVTEALGELNYNNAGTVEFVMDQEGQAYLIEVNTRIQVEHPVTEMICGRDLIQIQIETALSGALPLEQSDIDFTGHAMEVRVCAEDPSAGFAPEQGTVEHLVFPSGPGFRVDSYLETGTWISPYYDSMVGKIIAWERSRSKCIRRMQRGLGEVRIDGFKTTVPLFQWLLEQDEFQRGDFHTGYLAETDFKAHLSEEP